MQPLDLDLGGIHLRVTVDQPAIRGHALERYDGFFHLAPPKQADLEIHFRIDLESRPHRYHPVWVDSPPITSRGSMEHAWIEGEAFSGEIDWQRGNGTAVIPNSLAHLDLFVRIALGVELLRRRSTLLHAAAVVRDHFGIICSGPSGAGKSTIADICRDLGLRVLADEMVVARMQGASCRVIGSPFWHGERRSAPAGAVFILEQTETPRIERISAARALPRMMEAGGAPLALPDVQAAFFETCGMLLERIPAYRLGFSKNPGFWEVVDRLPEFAFFKPNTRQPLAPSTTMKTLPSLQSALSSADPSPTRPPRTPTPQHGDSK